MSNEAIGNAIMSTNCIKYDEFLCRKCNYISAYFMEFIPIMMYFVLHFSQLSEGSLDENSVVDGSRITLLPRAETGLLVRYNSSCLMFRR